MGNVSLTFLAISDGRQRWNDYDLAHAAIRIVVRLVGLALNSQIPVRWHAVVESLGTCVNEVSLTPTY